MATSPSRTLTAEAEAATGLQAASHALENSASLDPLLERIGDARLVLLGEASHGTSEFYTWRARLSQRLIAEKGFSFIAVEGDWPDCYRVNRYIKGYAEAGQSAHEVLQAFERWPTWMWANWEIVALCEWLRRHNASAARQAGFYGLDVYSLWESMAAIMQYLERADPEAARTARQAYLCFEPYGEDEQAYAWATKMVPETCEDEVVELLSAMRRDGARYDSDPEAAFSAEQNAVVMVRAERYYRAMVRSNAESWNVRDEHMADSLDRLLEFHGPGARAIVWAHNTHIGDARFTDMARAGMVNLGQLAGERYGGEEVVLAGFGTHRGSVVAGREWGAPMEVMPVPPARSGSWEAWLHQAEPADRLLLLDSLRGSKSLMAARGHRAIGVVYNPEYEAFGNYVPTILPGRYDSFLYVDQTRALHPLHVTPASQQPPGTYPWGL
jgi:erythromycin esterase